MQKTTVRNIVSLFKLDRYAGATDSIYVYTLDGNHHLGTHNGYYMIPEIYLDYTVKEITMGNRSIYISIDVPADAVIDFDGYDKRNTVKGYMNIRL